MIPSAALQPPTKSGTLSDMARTDDGRRVYRWQEFWLDFHGERPTDISKGYEAILEFMVSIVRKLSKGKELIMSDGRKVPLEAFLDSLVKFYSLTEQTPVAGDPDAQATFALA